MLQEARQPNKEGTAPPVPLIHAANSCCLAEHGDYTAARRCAKDSATLKVVVLLVVVRLGL